MKVPKASKDLHKDNVRHLEQVVLGRYIKTFETAVSLQDVDLIWDCGKHSR